MNKKLYEHLKHLKKKAEDQQTDFDQYKREQEAELKLKESESMMKLMQKLMQVHDIMHKTEIDNIKTLNAVEKERMGIEMDNLQHLLSETERFHKEKLEMIDIFTKNKLLEQEIDHKRELADTDQNNHILEIENKKYKSIIDSVKSQMQLLKEQNILSSKQVQTNNEIIELIKKDAGLTKKEASLYKKELKAGYEEKDEELEGRENNVKNAERTFDRKKRMEEGITDDYIEDWQNRMLEDGDDKK